MKSLPDFIEIGEKCGLKGEDLLTFARKELDAYKSELALEKKTELDKYERELRLEERRIKRVEAEKSSGGSNNAAAPGKPHAPNFKLEKFDDKKEDLDTWFTMFERKCSLFAIKEQDMKGHLYSCLSGKFAEALIAIDDSLTYEDTRNALLKRFNLTVDEYRKRFFNLQPRKDETMTGFGQRVDFCFEKWVSMASIEKKSYDELKDLVLSHILLNSCNSKLVAFWLERETKKFSNLVTTAEAFFQAHPDEDLFKQNNVFSGNAGYFSGNYNSGQNMSQSYGRGKFQRGHHDNRQFRGGYRQQGRGFQGNQNSHSGWYQNGSSNNSDQNWRGTRGRGQADMNWRGGSNDGRYENRGGWNDSRYENRSGWNDSRYGNRGGSNMVRNEQRGVSGDVRDENKGSNKKFGDENISQGKCCEVENWREVTPFVINQIEDKCFELPNCMNSLDQASSAGIGKVDHVYQGLLMVDGKQSEIRVLRDTGASVHAIHEDLVSTEQKTGKSITLITFGGKKEVFDTARIEVDTPFLKGVIEACILKGNVYPAEHRYYDVLIGNGLRNEKATDPSDQVVSKWLLEHGLLETANEVSTRASAKHKETDLKVKTYDFDISFAELAELQGKDISLQKYFDYVEKDAVKAPEGVVSFQIRNGLLVRLCRTHEEELIQIVVPEELRGRIIALGHDSLWGGHMGIEKTEDRVRTSFYWPGLHKDVRDYCLSCLECKKTSPQGKTFKAPLQVTPTIKRPFLRCATDLIGPLEMTEKKNRYILTLIDYATRWVEATPLKDITAEVIVEELMVFFSRIGIPSELLSDGGPQYTAQLMQEALKLLGINHALAAPYHPETNGLCEKANDTVKQMLRKVSADQPKKWDRLLPGVLFAYREVPQATTGLSPFEMVYGIKPRGPLSLLRDLWLQPDYDDIESKTHYQYVLDLKQRIESNCELACVRTKEQQALSKHYYDQKSKVRSLSVGDEVLLFLPTSASKLLAKWKGPYKVVEKVEGSNVNYMVDVDGKIKKYHINTLLHCPKRPDRLKTNLDKTENVVEKANSGLVEDQVPTILNKCCTVESNDVNCTQHAACALQTIDILKENRTAAAVSVIDQTNIDEEKEGVIPEIVLPSFSQKETYLDVKVSNDLTKEQSSEMNALLYEFRDIFSDVPSKTDCIEHNIQLTDNVPIQQKPYPLPLASEKIVAEEVQNMLNADVIQESDSPYASPIVLVKKKDGTHRFCIDYRKINKITRGDAHPIPDQEALFSKLAKAKYFTKIDMTKGYWQIGVQADSRQYTAFQAGGKLYEFKRMAFGLKNAPATFNKMMQSLFGDIDGSTFFFDDLTAFHEEWDTHIATLRIIFGIFRKNNLKGRPKKTEAGFTDVPLLGHHVGDGFLSPAAENVKKFLKITKPKNKKQVKSILGLVNYYGKFIPNLSTTLKPLQNLITKGAPERIIWTHDCEQALTSVQNCIFNDPKLLLCDIHELFFIQTDASDSGIGGCLLQKRDGELRPCLFVSRTLSKHERNYAVIEKEALAIIWTICKFARYLRCGRSFRLQTDHKPLEYIKTGALVNSRIARWALILQSFDFSVEYIPGHHNYFADFLSRNN